MRCFEDILKADNGNEEMWAVSTHADLSAGRRVSRESATPLWQRTTRGRTSL